MNEHVAPHNEEAETSVLGAILLTLDGRRLVADVTAETGLKPEHFYRPRHQTVFQSMLRLVDRNEPIDALTVSAQLAQDGELEEAGGTAFVHSLPNLVPSASNYAHYARIVRKHAYHREVLDLAREVQYAALTEDEDAVAEAIGRLSQPESTERRVTIESMQDEIVQHFDRRVDLIPWPFHALNEMTGGGLWAGHLTLLVGRSGHGKSVLADMVLETAMKHKARTRAYLTEMTPLERNLRFIARRTEIPLKRLMRANLMGGEAQKMTKAVQELPFDIQPCGTWKVDRLGVDILRRRPTVAVVDLWNVMSGREVRDIDESTARLAGIANDTGCHIIACNHLNRSRMTGWGYPPEPTEGDIRGSGALYDLSTNVLSVYRKELMIGGEGAGEASDEAVVRFLKVKNGNVGKLDAHFNGSRMRFELAREPGAVGSLAA